MIEVLEPAHNKRLTTVDAVKTELHIADTTQDALLEQLIDQASALIETYCNRCFARQTYRETIPGYGGLYLILTMRPVVSIQSIKEEGHVITDYFLESPQSGLIYRRLGWRWRPLTAGGITSDIIPNSEIANYEVEYTAGYVLPGENDRNLPADIEKACIDIVKNWYSEEQTSDLIQSESIGDYSVTYAKIDRTIPQTTMLILEKWRVYV